MFEVCIELANHFGSGPLLRPIDMRGTFESGEGIGYIARDLDGNLFQSRMDIRGIDSIEVMKIASAESDGVPFFIE